MQQRYFVTKIVMIYCAKNYSSDRWTLLKLETFWDYLEQFFLAVDHNNFGNKIPFLSRQKIFPVCFVFFFCIVMTINFALYKNLQSWNHQILLKNASFRISTFAVWLETQYCLIAMHWSYCTDQNNFIQWFRIEKWKKKSYRKKTSKKFQIDE